MIDARDAIALMAGITFAGSYLLTSRAIEAWMHRRRCSMCARAHRSRRALGLIAWR